MSDTNTQAFPVTTPSDGEPAIKPQRRQPRRYKLFDDLGGDFRIYEVMPAGHPKALAGSLVPIVEFGGYESAIEAKKALRAGGDKLQGKTCLILRAIEIVRIVVETKPRILIESKPRKQVSGPVTDQPATTG